jgi:hypothetical protein
VLARLDRIEQRQDVSDAEVRGVRAVIGGACRVAGVEVPDLDVTQPLPILSVVRPKRETA